MKSKSSKGGVAARTSNVISDPVCEFYTSHPYPPPVENLDRARDMWQDENVHRAEYHLLWPDKEYRPDLDVLVAGCGTWQAAKYALCHPAARVVGIDVSPTSLEHTEKLKQKYNLTNLETRQLPIENAGDLGQLFDHIICTGVLHHLVDPDCGFARAPLCVESRRRDVLDVVRALRSNRRSHASGILPETWHRNLETRD